jgi:hypothetical protein
MTDDRSLERAARSWLDEGPSRAPDRTVEAALYRIQTTNQERDLRIPWRFPTMNPIMRIAAAALVAAVAVGGAYLAFRPASNVGPATPTIEGAWETNFTRAEMLAAGIADSLEDNTENWGHFVIGIREGRFVSVQLSGPMVTGPSAGYAVAGNKFTATFSDDVFTWTFTVTDTTLTFGGNGPVFLRAKPWTRVGPPNPVPTASTATLATYKAARDAICVAARTERADYDARIGDGLYAPGTPAAARAASITAFGEFADWVGTLLDRLESIPAPASMAVDVSVVNTRSRGVLQLIRSEIPLLQAGKLTEALAADGATGPLSAGVEEFESLYGLEPCP